MKITRGQFKPGDRMAYMIPEDASISPSRTWPPEWGLGNLYPRSQFTVLNDNRLYSDDTPYIGVIDQARRLKFHHGELLVLEFCTESGKYTPYYTLWKLVEEPTEADPS